VAEPQAEGQKQRWEIKQIFSILALDAKDHRQIGRQVAGMSDIVVCHCSLYINSGPR